MSRHVVVDSAAHRALRVRAEASAELGDAVMACFTMPAEFRRVQNEFPILFRRDLESGRFSALALFGFEDGENLFLTDRRWAARYRPLALAVQPFLVGRPADGEGPAQVHIDLDHPRISNGEDGVRLFDQDGGPTPYLEAATGQLGELDEGHRGSADFYAAIERFELLEPFTLDVQLDDGARRYLAGFHIVDEAKLRALDPGSLGALHGAGHLMPLFMAMASLSNLARLVERKNRAIRGG
ncbi:MAG: multidrug transporter [Alphaproteobacteria bacterium]|nr:multidrug transporter [Alphaproteobacteria bacterium]